MLQGTLKCAGVVLERSLSIRKSLNKFRRITGVVMKRSWSRRGFGVFLEHQSESEKFWNGPGAEFFLERDQSVPREVLKRTWGGAGVILLHR